MLQAGELWRWTLNSEDHPDDPRYNVFLVLPSDWEDATKVLYLASGRVVSYHASSFDLNMQYLERI